MYFLMGLLILSSSVSSAAAFRFELGPKSFISYYSNSDLTQKNESVEQAVIVTHGTDRNAEEYFQHMVEAADLADALPQTLILAPHFKTVDDQPATNEVWWGSRWTEKWKYGFESQGREGVSSFEIMDRIVKAIGHGALFPNLKKIIIIGHSAGGQFVQRYAVGTTEDLKLRSQISMEFVVSNPSSYLYLSATRPAPPAADCREYDDYIYGLKNRNKYLSSADENALARNYSAKKVIYLIGGADTESADLDQGCEAVSQGQNRRDRGEQYFSYINKKFAHKHLFRLVEGVGHDHAKIFSSPEGLDVIFKKSAGPVPQPLPRTSVEYYSIGNSADKDVKVENSFALMGGGTDFDQVFSWFLKKSNAGDIVVLSAKDIKETYNDYLWNLSKKTSDVDSVESFVIKSKTDSQDAFLLSRIRSAEGLFFTGGDQLKYMNFIAGTPLADEINQALKRGLILAGTSAGLAIHSETVFSARSGSIESEEALENPFSSRMTLESGFLLISSLALTVADTHFAERDRMGRLLSFMARHQKQNRLNQFQGLGISENTALLIDDRQQMQVVGPGAVYILKSSMTPKVCEQGRPLTFEKIEVRKITSTSEEKYELNVRKGQVTSSKSSGSIY